MSNYPYPTSATLSLERRVDALVREQLAASRTMIDALKRARREISEIEFPLGDRAFPLVGWDQRGVLMHLDDLLLSEDRTLGAVEDCAFDTARDEEIA